MYKIFTLIALAVLIGSIASPAMSAFAKDDPIEDISPPQVVTTHNNNLINENIFESSSTIFEFPPGSDHEFRLNLSVDADGSIPMFPNTFITPNNFLINNPPAQQVSQAVYDWFPNNNIDVTQTVETLAGNQYSIWNIKLTNTGSSPINIVRLAVYNDWDVDGTTFNTAVYDPITDTSYEVGPGGTHAGMSSPTASSEHDIDSCCSNAASLLTFANNANGPLGPFDVTASLLWNLGSLNPGEMKSIDVIVAAGNSLNDLNTQIANAKESLDSETVGGEFLPIDSTALLMAGMSANLSLIVPIAAGIAGAGAIIIRSRMNKE